MTKIRIDLSVATDAELTTVPVSGLREGANAWVIADNDYWTLEKNSGATPGANILQPLAGNPISGAANARWIRQSGGVGESGVGVFIYRQGAVSPVAPVYGTLQEAVQAAKAAVGSNNTSNGPGATIVIDGSLGQPTTVAGAYDLTGVLEFTAAAATTLNVVVGTTFAPLNDGPGLRITGSLTLAALGITAPVIGGSATVELGDGSGITLNSACTAAFILPGGAATLQLFMAGSSILTSSAAAVPVIDSTGATAVNVSMYDGATISTNSTGGTAGLWNIKIFSSNVVFNATQLTAILPVWQPGCVVGGTVTIAAAGVSPNVVVPGLTATSRIVVSAKTFTPGANATTVEFSALASSRTTGLAAKFNITALTAAAAANTTDVSVLDWVVYY